jgi:hypothetical protein
MAKKRPGARPTRGRAKTKSAGPNARKSRPKADNAGRGNR